MNFSRIDQVDPNNPDQLLKEYGEVIQEINDILAEIPELPALEKLKEDLGKMLRDYSVKNGPVSGHGFNVSVSERDSWDTKKLPGFAAAYPALNELKTTIKVATIRKEK